MKIRLYTGEKQALVVQQFQSLVEVVKMAFGGGSKDSKPVEIADTPEKVKAGFARVFG